MPDIKREIEDIVDIDEPYGLEKSKLVEMVVERLEVDAEAVTNEIDALVKAGKIEQINSLVRR